MLVRQQARPPATWPGTNRTGAGYIREEKCRWRLYFAGVLVKVTVGGDHDSVTLLSTYVKLAFTGSSATTNLLARFVRYGPVILKIAEVELI